MGGLLILHKKIYLPDDAVIGETGRVTLEEFCEVNDFEIESGFDTDMLETHLEPNYEQSLGIIILTTNLTRIVEETIENYPETVIIVVANVEFSQIEHDYLYHFKTEEHFCNFMKNGIYTIGEFELDTQLPDFLEPNDEEVKTPSADGLFEQPPGEPAEKQIEDDFSSIEGMDTGTAHNEESSQSLTELDSDEHIKKDDVADVPKKIVTKGSRTDAVKGSTQKLQLRVGVWSPIHRTGVSTFIESFAFFLSENHYKTVVLESLTKKFKLRQNLLRYTKQPSEWSSLVNAVNGEIEFGKTSWEHEGVYFFPLDSSYKNYTWTEETIAEYYLIEDTVQVQLIDIPSGELLESEETVFAHIDELWIMADDAYHEIATWKNVINEYKEKYQLPMKILFNKTQEHSKPKFVSKELSMPVIETLPDLYKKVTCNYYAKTPLYFAEGIREEYAECFNKLLEYLKYEAAIKQEVPKASLKKKMKQIQSKFLKAIGY